MLRLGAVVFDGPASEATQSDFSHVLPFPTEGQGVGGCGEALTPRGPPWPTVAEVVRCRRRRSSRPPASAAPAPPRRPPPRLAWRTGRSRRRLPGRSGRPYLRTGREARYPRRCCSRRSAGARKLCPTYTGGHRSGRTATPLAVRRVELDDVDAVLPRAPRVVRCGLPDGSRRARTPSAYPRRRLQNRIDCGYGKKSTTSPALIRRWQSCQNSGSSRSAWWRRNGSRSRGSPSRNVANSSGKTSFRATLYHGSAASSASGFGGGGMRRKLHVGQVLDLVVVVEHDPVVAGDAEVPPEHVAGEDVRDREVADRVAVVAHGGSSSSGVARSR